MDSEPQCAKCLWYRCHRPWWYPFVIIKPVIHFCSNPELTFCPVTGASILMDAFNIRKLKCGGEFYETC